MVYLTDQHLILRLIIMISAFTANLGSSFRQLAMQSGLFLVFFLLEPASYLRILKALRFLLSFLAAYWLMATLLGQPFLLMSLFSLRLLFFLLLSVYTFSHLSIARVLHDCSFLLKYRIGNLLIQYILATILFINSFRIHWQNAAKEQDIDLSKRFFLSIKLCHQDLASIATQVENAILNEQSYAAARPASSLIGIALLTMMALLGAL